MEGAPELYWLPSPPSDWRQSLKALPGQTSIEHAWEAAVSLAGYRIGFALTNALGSTAARLFGDAPPASSSHGHERLAVLSSSTTDHLHEAIRVGALRRGIWLSLYGHAYGQYRQELLDEQSGLYKFSPTSVIFCLDADHVTRGVENCKNLAETGQLIETVAGDIANLWRIARDRLGCHVLQQSIVPRFAPVIGNNEHRLPTSRAAFVAKLNDRLRVLADAEKADIIALDMYSGRAGPNAWCSTSLWLKAKQEINLIAAPVYGDLVARLLASRRGRSAKCCVFDLDNTLWGGVIGDDGETGIAIGNGTTLGEAFLSVQVYARELRRRGVILAVCSKNTESVARGGFERNPDMILKLDDFACFVANWSDKATNLRTIAKDLNIGLDALVFVDDNPFEREWVRRELPMVFVPELPLEPENYVECLADSGAFEMASITEDDLSRADRYGEARRLNLAAASQAGDFSAYLADLDMSLIWGRVTPANLERVVQLTNKTNQFNLTTRRYSEQEMRTLTTDNATMALQFRLSDRFGDHGLIAVVIGRMRDNDQMELDTWLMSCRVLGRKVEEATLNVVAYAARRMGARALLGVYRPTNKNEMVRDHYRRLGFHNTADVDDGAQAVLEIENFEPLHTQVRLSEVLS